MILTPRLEKAIGIAITIHAGQARKGDKETPYATHPVMVAMLLSQYTEDEDVIIAGLLHDAIEDTSFRKEDIKKVIGGLVADIVEEVTEQNKTAPWENRKMACIAKIKDMSKRARLVLCADKVCNIRALTGAHRCYGRIPWENFNAPKEKVLWYFRAVYEEMAKHLEHGLVRDLGKAVEQLEAGKPTIFWDRPARYIGPFDLVRQEHGAAPRAYIRTYDWIPDAAREATRLTQLAKARLFADNPAGGENAPGRRWGDGCSYGVFDSTGKAVYWPDWYDM